MKKMKWILIIVSGLLSALIQAQDANNILLRVDRNMSSKNRVFESSMIIHGKRNSRTVSSKTYSEGSMKSFTEYLAPASDKGTKMLKVEGQLWIYSPAADRTIQISGHLLRQSVMGSDLSYEDMMDDRKLADIYSAQVVGNDTLNGRQVWVLELTAKVSDVAYYKQKMWIDKERFIPIRQELFARSGQLLKRTDLSEVKNIQGRWFPTKIVYKDMLKDGNGTEFRMTNVKFDQEIPDYIFTKAALKQ